MQKGNIVKRIVWFLSIITLFGLLGCGSGSSKKAEELLNRILTLVGIPQEIVVNICQDTNDNGICEAHELHTKIKISRGDSAKDIFNKIKFQPDGTYLLEHYDPTKKILMEIEDNAKLDNTGQRVTLSYHPSTQELSILQSLVDNGFLLEDNVKPIRESKNRDIIDNILLNNIFINQRLLEENNMSAQNATTKNLEYIAEGLLDINITSTM